MAREPGATDRADVDLYFDIGGKAVDVGQICTELRLVNFLNGGYAVYGRVRDAHFNILNKILLDSEYLLRGRSDALRCQFRYKWDGITTNRTPLQTAYVVSMLSGGGAADNADVEFAGIDPPSWFLNCGNSSGQAYRGRVCDVIRRCVAEYAPEVTLNVSETSDGANNTHWMLRRDPKTFILSLLEWATPLTASQTQWLVKSDELELSIREQASVPSAVVGTYVGPNVRGRAASVREWELFADNGLSTANHRIVTAGASAVSGAYYDEVATPDAVSVSDENTERKYKARTTAEKAFTGAAGDIPQRNGTTFVRSKPELYSGGEIGVRYRDYIDGRARSMWLALTNAVMRCRFTVVGHGDINNSVNLGADTITMQWLDIEGRQFLLAGNWLLYGFEQRYHDASWYTDIYCARFDYDATARAVPPADR